MRSRSQNSITNLIDAASPPRYMGAIKRRKAMSKVERFIHNNPSHKLVIRFKKIMNGELSINGSYGKLLGQLMREAEAGQ